MREAYNAGGRTRVNMGFPGQIRHKRALESQGGATSGKIPGEERSKVTIQLLLNAADKHPAGADQTC